jgi:hypothetical protein
MGDMKGKKMMKINKKNLKLMELPPLTTNLRENVQSNN